MIECKTDSQKFESRKRQFEDINKILPQIGTSKRGKKILYHTGFLFRDITENGELFEMASRMNMFCVMGLIELVQKKITDYEYQYFAVVK